jgi:hypothetical protein
MSDMILTTICCVLVTYICKLYEILVKVCLTFNFMVASWSRKRVTNIDFSFRSWKFFTKYKTFSCQYHFFLLMNVQWGVWWALNHSLHNKENRTMSESHFRARANALFCLQISCIGRFYFSLLDIQTDILISIATHLLNN